MEIVSCPKCDRPRALGHRCPSCGDPAAPVDQHPAAPDGAASWRAESGAWAGTSGPGGGLPGRTVADPPQRASGGKKRWGVLASAIVALVLIAAAATVAVVLFTGGAAVVEQQAAVVSTPDRGHDQAAKSLLRNAMTAMDAAFVEHADYTAITQATLTAMEPAIAWMRGGGAVSSSPPAGAKARQNAVAWVCTGRMTYELGTWSESGVQFGVRVDRAGGGKTYYVGGVVTSW